MGILGLQPIEEFCHQYLDLIRQHNNMLSQMTQIMNSITLLQSNVLYQTNATPTDIAYLGAITTQIPEYTKAIPTPPSVSGANQSLPSPS